MRPLTVVNPLDLQVGEKYLIEYIGEHEHSKPRCKGVFTGNILPECEYQCILSKFNNLQDSGPPLKPDYEYKLQDCFYKYYKADALTRAYTTHVLRTITGDPDFQFVLPVTKKMRVKCE
jgi:hypothetical protein